MLFGISWRAWHPLLSHCRWLLKNFHCKSQITDLQTRRVAMRQQFNVLQLQDHLHLVHDQLTCRKMWWILRTNSSITIYLPYTQNLLLLLFCISREAPRHLPFPLPSRVARRGSPWRQPLNSTISQMTRPSSIGTRCSWTSRTRCSRTPSRPSRGSRRLLETWFWWV